MKTKNLVIVQCITCASMWRAAKGQTADQVEQEFQDVQCPNCESTRGWLIHERIWSRAEQSGLKAIKTNAD